MSIRSVIKSTLTIYVDAYARLRGISFPTKYGIRWKLAMLTGKYESETTRTIRSILQPGDTFIDIGAHIGYFTRIAAKQVGTTGHVISFEADAANFDLLKKNTSHFANVVLVNEAIGETEGTATFYHVQGSTGCHSLIKSQNSRSYEVHVTTLDNYLKKIDGAAHVIKMDIEGGEWMALNGMQQTLQDPHVRLIMEYNPVTLSNAGIDPHLLLKRLFALGFSIEVLDPSKTFLLPPSDLGLIDAHLDSGSVNILARKDGPTV